MHFPVKIFHHIPKTGGTSFRLVLENWFNVVDDYISIDELKGSLPIRAPIDLEKLSNTHCVCGHFESRKNALFLRYPELTSHPDRFQIFTIIRHPLELQVSMYNFAKQTGMFGQVDSPLEDFILFQKNYISNRLQCTPSNYKEIMDRYIFVGLQEELQQSLNILGSILGKEPIPLTRSNQSRRENSLASLSRKAVQRFEECNRLDYQIYDYAKIRFERSMLLNKDAHT
ncbi:hypothetical protein U5801_22415 [Lamprobacter modestohalophilus]|uniref:hypothetical protein n=1 Tax=Lamprobacter modestohalophilus TaxID=1064514 RepID=UPI002ADEF5CE|nr:hypothetical protein [Lamprobacter modestohalophilus]MEA1052539.1 hypothetical protein [Lamprobacter modestohalophilus]